MNFIARTALETKKMTKGQDGTHYWGKTASSAVCPRKRVASFPLGISVEKYRVSKQHNAEVTNKGFHVEALERAVMTM